MQRIFDALKELRFEHWYSDIEERALADTSNMVFSNLEFKANKYEAWLKV